MKLYFGNAVTTATTLMILALLGFIGWSVFNRANIQYTVRLILTAQAAPLTVRTIFSCYSSMLVTLVMSLGSVSCLVIMGHRIKHSACGKNLFIRCLMPSFLFIPVSDIFMLLSALAHGNLPHTLFRRHKCPAQEKGTHL